MLQINNSRSTLRNCHLKPNAVFYKTLKINQLASIHFISLPFFTIKSDNFAL